MGEGVVLRTLLLIMGEGVVSVGGSVSALSRSIVTSTMTTVVGNIQILTAITTATTMAISET